MTSPQLGHFVQSPAGSSRFLSEVKVGLLKIPMVAMLIARGRQPGGGVRNDCGKAARMRHFLGYSLAARDCNHAHGGRPRVQEHAAAFLHGTARGENIVHKDQMTAVHLGIVPHSESSTQVFHAFFAA
jgi:hypothetical protein